MFACVAKESRVLSQESWALGFALLQSSRVTLESSLNLKVSGSHMGMDGKGDS